jgi:hypothetical protein
VVERANSSDPVTDEAYPRIGPVDTSLPRPPTSHGRADFQESQQREPEQEVDV